MSDEIDKINAEYYEIDREYYKDLQEAALAVNSVLIKETIKITNKLLNLSNPAKKISTENIQFQILSLFCKSALENSAKRKNKDFKKTVEEFKQVMLLLEDVKLG